MTMYDELVKKLREQADYYCCHMGINSPPAMMFIEAADAIEELSKMLDEEVEVNTALECNVPVWIPVSERLPEKIGLYLTYDMNVWSRPFEKQAMAYWDGEHFQVSKFSAVTHWMPLPEPPKDGEA